jgi:RNA recognition motif. (a.k.a. RRM, RBD, or RNP domain)
MYDVSYYEVLHLPLHGPLPQQYLVLKLVNVITVTLNASAKRDQFYRFRPCRFLKSCLISMDDISTVPPPSAAMTGVMDTSTNGIEPVVPASTATPPEEAENACETLYIQNLNEKIKPDGVFTFYYFLPSLFDDISTYVSVLKASLRGLFKVYGEVLDVVAHGNLRMRGQAFVSFASTESAAKAMKDIQRFPLYSKPMVCRFCIS